MGSLAHQFLSPKRAHWPVTRHDRATRSVLRPPQRGRLLLSRVSRNSTGPFPHREPPRRQCHVSGRQAFETFTTERPAAAVKGARLDFLSAETRRCTSPP